MDGPPCPDEFHNVHNGSVDDTNSDEVLEGIGIWKKHQFTKTFGSGLSQRNNNHRYQRQ